MYLNPSDEYLLWRHYYGDISQGWQLAALKIELQHTYRGMTKKTCYVWDQQPVFSLKKSPCSILSTSHVHVSVHKIRSQLQVLYMKMRLHASN